MLDPRQQITWTQNAPSKTTPTKTNTAHTASTLSFKARSLAWMILSIATSHVAAESFAAAYQNLTSNSSSWPHWSHAKTADKRYVSGVAHQLSAIVEENLPDLGPLSLNLP
jgi:hypothetical protein